jgi:hypothetical protein
MMEHKILEETKLLKLLKHVADIAKQLYSLISCNSHIQPLVTYLQAVLKI